MTTTTTTTTYHVLAIHLMLCIIYSTRDRQSSYLHSIIFHILAMYNIYQLFVPKWSIRWIIISKTVNFSKLIDPIVIYSAQNFISSHPLQMNLTRYYNIGWVLSVICSRWYSGVLKRTKPLLHEVVPFCIVNQNGRAFQTIDELRFP